MTTIVTHDGRIGVPQTRESNGNTQKNIVSVKASGWVKYRKDGEITHLPPSQVIRIEEPDPMEKRGVGGDTHKKSNVSYQSPHGRV